MGDSAVEWVGTCWLYFLFEFWEVVTVDFSVLFLYFELVSLLFFVVDVPLPVSFGIVLQYLFYFIQLLFQGSHPCLQVIVYVFLYVLVLSLFNLLCCIHPALIHRYL